jgi:hypothetical protein
VGNKALLLFPETDAPVESESCCESSGDLLPTENILKALWLWLICVCLWFESEHKQTIFMCFHNVVGQTHITKIANKSLQM